MKLFNKIIKLLYKHYQCKVISIWLSWVYFIFSQFQYCEIIIFVNFSQLPFISICFIWSNSYLSSAVMLFVFCCYVNCLLLLFQLSSAVMFFVFCCYVNCLLLLCQLYSAVMSTVFCCFVNCLLLFCQLSSAIMSTVFCCYVNCLLLLHQLSSSVVLTIVCCYVLQTTQSLWVSLYRHSHTIWE